jgi:hypothetical protein
MDKLFGFAEMQQVSDMAGTVLRSFARNRIDPVMFIPPTGVVVEGESWTRQVVRLRGTVANPVSVCLEVLLRGC